MGKAFSKMTPRIARVFVLVSLQNYFSQHPEYPWNRDRSKTEIFIQSDFAKDARHQNVDPIIVVEGGNISYSQLGITNNLIDLQDPKLYLYDTYHQFSVDSSMSIHCICSASDAAEELGFEVAMFLQGMRLHIGEMLQLQNITMPQQTKAQMMGGTDWSGKWDSVVSFGYKFALKRKHSPLDPGELLKTIEFYLKHPLDTPMPGDVDGNGDPINIGNQPGNTGGTNTGGQTGNWGGNGGTNDTPGNVADGVDDGWVTLEMKVSNTEVTGGQN